jgi:hypothetical protein
MKLQFFFWAVASSASISHEMFNNIGSGYVSTLPVAPVETVVPSTSIPMQLTQKRKASRCSSPDYSELTPTSAVQARSFDAAPINIWELPAAR